MPSFYETPLFTSSWVNSLLNNNNNTGIVFCDGSVPTYTDFNTTQLSTYYSNNHLFRVFRSQIIRTFDESTNTYTLDFTSMDFTTPVKTGTATWFMIGYINSTSSVGTARNIIWGSVGDPGSGADLEMLNRNFDVNVDVRIQDSFSIPFASSWTWS